MYNSTSSNFYRETAPRFLYIKNTKNSKTKVLYWHIVTQATFSNKTNQYKL